MSRLIGLPSMTPMRAFGSSMKSAQWLPSTVTRLHTPGKMLLRPPEKPAKKCGSMNPSDTTRSAFATSELTTRRAPEGSGPRSVSGDESQSWTTMCSRETISSPSLWTSSSGVVPRWHPVATSIVISMSGFPARSSSSMNGTISLLGTGRVWSLMMSTAFFFPAASSRSFGEPIGESIAARTIAPPSAPASSS